MSCQLSHVHLMSETVNSMLIPCDQIHIKPMDNHPCPPSQSCKKMTTRRPWEVGNLLLYSRLCNKVRSRVVGRILSFYSSEPSLRSSHEKIGWRETCQETGQNMQHPKLAVPVVQSMPPIPAKEPHPWPCLLFNSEDATATVRSY